MKKKEGTWFDRIMKENREDYNNWPDWMKGIFNKKGESEKSQFESRNSEKNSKKKC